MFLEARFCNTFTFQKRIFANPSSNETILVITRLQLKLLTLPVQGCRKYRAFCQNVIIIHQPECQVLSRICVGQSQFLLQGDDQYNISRGIIVI